ncbi:MAG TPA: dihydrolipoyl dehydrogenase [Candidatus Limivivens merdigallinarum]|uniref:Dihydrolipoyl dehydrogenase n=1 Tax=Candidatus Limivivens merdigallinarum TaxID=2840859 RepID=A0A9D0ZTY8_9FIRM|nr:dihydrolipoyl dehydrogenase [Candidatus Limivivens merdigallinarum]
MGAYYDLIVIGGGPAGYTAAAEGAKKGMKAALIERKAIGGTCLNEGCIPTKTLMHCTELYREVKAGEGIGLYAKELSCDMGKLQDYKEGVIGELQKGIGIMLKQNKVTVYEGTGQIVEVPEPGEDSGKIKVQVGDEVLEAGKVLISTGSVPMKLPIPGMDLEGVLDSTRMLSERTIPKSLLIIGGGVIGVEFATVYHALGCKVTIVEALDKILAGLDREISQSMKMQFKKMGIEVHTGARVKEIRKEEELCCTFVEKEQEISISCEKILVAAGRRADTSGLLGEGISLEMEKGRILVDETFKTSIPGIYAVGDVIGGIQLAHVAEAEAINTVCAMNGTASRMNLKLVPSCIYTSPEIASVGMTADEAKAAGIEAVSAKYLTSANGKSVLSGQERGFVKLVAEKSTGRLLGAQLFCARATDMISELSAAIAEEMTVQKLSGVIHPHPTFSEAIWEAARLTAEKTY